MLTVALYNLQSGTAKSTSAVCLAQAFALIAGRTLLIDLDPEGVATRLLNQASAPDLNLARLKRNPAALEKLTLHLTANLSLIPANPNMLSPILKAQTVPPLPADISGATDILKNSLRTLARRFQFCVIDTTPIKCALLANALCAADVILIPVVADYFAPQQLDKAYSYLSEVMCNKEDVTILCKTSNVNKSHRTVWALRVKAECEHILIHVDGHPQSVNSPHDWRSKWSDNLAPTGEPVAFWRSDHDQTVAPQIHQPQQGAGSPAIDQVEKKIPSSPVVDVSYSHTASPETSSDPYKIRAASHEIHSTITATPPPASGAGQGKNLDCATTAVRPLVPAPVASTRLGNSIEREAGASHSASARPAVSVVPALDTVIPADLPLCFDPAVKPALELTEHLFAKSTYHFITLVHEILKNQETRP